MPKESSVSKLQAQLSLSSSCPASCNQCLCPLSCGTCPGPHGIPQWLTPCAGAAQESLPLLAETGGAEEALPTKELTRNQPVLGLLPCSGHPTGRHSPLCLTVSVPRPWAQRALREMMQCFVKHSLFLLGDPTAHGKPIQGGMNSRDFSGWEGTEEPILTLKQTFHSSLQPDVVSSHVIPSLCSFFADAL